LATTDVLVIGGGIIGVSAAYFLSRRGIDAALVEKAAVGREASGSTAGTMSFQNKKIEVVPLVQEALRVWAGLQEELGDAIEFRQPGGFRVAESEEQENKLRASVKDQQDLGIKVEVMTGSDLKKAASYFGPAVRAASFCKDDARSNPLTAPLAIARGAEKNGLTLRERSEAAAIQILGKNRFRVQTAGGDIECARILNCSGVWARKIFTMAGVQIPITLDPMQVMVTERTPRIFPHIITHVSGNMTLKHVDSGNVVIGGGWTGVGDEDRGIKQVNYDSMQGNLAYAARVIPALGHLHLIRCWTGLEGRTPDLLPLMGELKQVPGFFSACCAKGGWTLGPLLGRTAAELIAGETPAIDISDYDVNRHADLCKSE
jgi:glycine/D-amino acid oxidase-like deaminating enzyme